MMALVDNQEFQSLIDKYNNLILCQREIDKNILSRFYEIVENFAESPIIPPEIIDEIRENAFGNISTYKEYISLYAVSMLIIDDCNKNYIEYQRNIEKLLSYWEVVKIMHYSSTERVRGSLEKMYEEDAYWCQQHWLNGVSSLAVDWHEMKSHLESGSIFVEKAVYILKKLLEYVNYYNQKYSRFMCDVATCINEDIKE